MSLDAKAKYQIYKEELEKQKEQEEQEEKSKLENLTEEEREQVFRDFSEKNVVLVDENNLLLPDEKKQKIYCLIIGGGWFFLWVFVSFALAIFWGIACVIVRIVLGLKNVIVDTPKISFACPFCGNEHINIIRPEEIRESEDTGFIHAQCGSCKKHFNLLVMPNVLKHFPKK